MAELGNVLPQIIYAMGTAPLSKGPLLFSKLDIKDGYWCMVVPEDDEWNLAYVLCKLDPNEEMILVIPSSLQMGWTDSPAFFCAASETAHDVEEALAAKPQGSLKPHFLEPFMLLSNHWPSHSPGGSNPQDDQDDEKAITDFLYLLESYVDDFIGLAQTTNADKLRHLSRAMLHAIHSVFPPTAVTRHDGEDPIALKKLLAGNGIWDVQEEILGWFLMASNDACGSRRKKSSRSLRSCTRQPDPPVSQPKPSKSSEAAFAMPV
jgi:hypothetical protein